MAGQRPTPPLIGDPPDFGKNVLILDNANPGNAETQAILNERLRHLRQISKVQTEDGSEFAQDRYAILFKQGTYVLDDLNVDVGYYMTIHGLGDQPGDVVIKGQVRSPGSSNPATPGMALNNFWRGIENIAVEPMDDKGNTKDKEGKLIPNVWAVSQATFMRRVHIHGNLNLAESVNRNWSSGGFIADSVVDGVVASMSQQQFLTRNVSLNEWTGEQWNLVFVGDENAPVGSWPDKPYTKIDKTPIIREKPYLTCGKDGNFMVHVPRLHEEISGVSWSRDNGKGKTIPISQCFVARAGTYAATASEMNKRLSKGYHIILTPGVYHLDQSLVVNYKDTVILGLGMATLVSDYGTPALMIADVDGVSVSGVIFDAGPQRSSSLLVVGYNVPHGLPGLEHNNNPTALFDCSARVGGEGRAAASNCFTVNSSDVILDNVWLWRADHGRMGTHDPSVVGWDTNPAENGLTVNGDRVVAYGLFVEHFQGYQTVWNGDDGQVYFYQSEIPYDVPNQTQWRWQHATKGFASYKISDKVVSHTAYGLGVYCNFWYHNIQLDNAIEVPNLKDRPDGNINMNNMCTVWLDGTDGSGINHVVRELQADGRVINEWGDAVVTRTDQPKPSQVMNLKVKWVKKK